MKIRKCDSCKIYTFKESCPRCSQKTASPQPPSFSLDKYSRYRRAVKQV